MTNLDKMAKVFQPEVVETVLSNWFEYRWLGVERDSEAMRELAAGEILETLNVSEI